MSDSKTTRDWQTASLLEVENEVRRRLFGFKGFVEAKEDGSLFQVAYHTCGDCGHGSKEVTDNLYTNNLNLVLEEIWPKFQMPDHNIFGQLNIWSDNTGEVQVIQKPVPIFNVYWKHPTEAASVVCRVFLMLTDQFGLVK